jgi:putative membrane-bound dehydrogenase-like protein
LLIVFVLGCPLPVGTPAPAHAGEFKLGERTLKVPAGFVVERIAGPPLVDRPITIAFDEVGRLYVSDSSGSNDNVQKQLAERPHRILRLEDRDGDGRFDSRTVFADKMMFPEGTMWLDGSLYVSAPPSIWKLTDTDGDGVADKRMEWFQGKTLTGCANDLHGPYLGPDGWIYWCKGAFAQQTYARTGKKPFVTRAAHIFRCRPDGTEVEPVMTGGMDNPVDVAFTPGGERILTCTFFQHPGGGNRDGLIHAVYGGIYGKLHGPIFDPVHRWTGSDVMPVLLHMGPAAPCGFTRYQSTAFGQDFRDNFFACYFNLHKVSRHILTPRGPTFETMDAEFLSSPDLDFHPTDVVEDADGSLIVVDTGGWYKLCCPSSQLHKPDVLGGIYRVRHQGAAPLDDPRGLKLRWESLTEAALVGLLDDPRPAIQERAIASLARRGELAVRALMQAGKSDRSVSSRRNAVWTATRIDHPSARRVVLSALTDPDETVRQAAIHSVSLKRDREALCLLTKLLAGPSLQNRRAAAEALGRIGEKSSVPELLKALGALSMLDRILEHSLTYALIEIGDSQGTAQGLQSTSVRVRRATLMALDQMDGGSLSPHQVARFLKSNESGLKETSSWIVSRHPEWAGALTEFFRDRLTGEGMTSGEQTELERLLAKFSAAAEIQTLLAERIADPSTPQRVKISSMKAMAQSGLKDVPESWVTGLASLIGADSPLTVQAVETARTLALNPEKARPLAIRLLAVGGREQTSPQLRLAALTAVPGGLSRVDSSTLAFLVTQVSRERPAPTRSAAADVLARAHLGSAQLGTLVDTLKEVGPLEVDRLLSAFDQSTDDVLGLKLVKALGDASSLSSLRADVLKQHLAKFGPPVQTAAQGLYAKLNADAAIQKTKMDDLMSKISTGDLRRGQVVFHSEKAACFTCHAIGYRGGNVGPDLTKVGQIRTERDLLEAIVYPSASFIRSYEPVVVAKSNGTLLNGLLRNETSEEILLVTGANQEARISRADVEEIRPSSVSIMPAGLDQQLTTQELADLVAFLKACR